MMTLIDILFKKKLKAYCVTQLVTLWTQDKDIIYNTMHMTCVIEYSLVNT